jgi:hypothetical protein
MTSADNGLPKVTIPIVSPARKISGLIAMSIHLLNNLMTYNFKFPHEQKIWIYKITRILYEVTQIVVN